MYIININEDIRENESLKKNASVINLFELDFCVVIFGVRNSAPQK